MDDRTMRNKRMQWWREARYGMFIHYNVFSLWQEKDYLGGCPEGMGKDEYNRLRAAKLQPTKAAVQEWAQVAKAAGMKYAVLTTKHSDAFPLWDSKVNPYNAVHYGPKRDIVAEYVKACHANGLKVGFYYCLRDQHHGFWQSGATDEAARQGVVKYTMGLLRELMTGYGKVDILWYDEPSPMGLGDEWDSEKINAMVRQLQPGIIINDRSLTWQDFTCSENHITPTNYPDIDWECCLTFNGTWAWHPKKPKDYFTPQRILDVLQQCGSMGGNFLLNVGPNPKDGRISRLEVGRLKTVGQWMKVHGEALYGPNDRSWSLNQAKVPPKAKWSRKGESAYLWMFQWPGKSSIVIRGLKANVTRCSLLTTGKALTFKQTPTTLTIEGLPRGNPDKACGVPVVKIQFAGFPR